MSKMNATQHNRAYSFLKVLNANFCSVYVCFSKNFCIFMKQTSDVFSACVCALYGVRERWRRHCWRRIHLQSPTMWPRCWRARASRSPSLLSISLGRPEPTLLQPERLHPTTMLPLNFSSPQKLLKS
jgi:hypothetical protein